MNDPHDAASRPSTKQVATPRNVGTGVASLCLFLCLAFAAPLEPARGADVDGGPATSALPDRVSLSYSLARATIEIARVDETWERKGTAYSLVSEARAVGVAALLARGQGWRRESVGMITTDGLRPLQFTDQRGSNPAQRARFDWDAKLIRFERLTTGGSGNTAPAEPGDAQALPAGTNDRLSFLYSIAQRARVPAGTWTVAITDGRRVTQYRFQVTGRETLDTPAGRFDTLRISRVREKGDTGTDVWLALDRSLIPVRVMVTEPDGTIFDQLLVQIGPS
ncbi:MAG: DUF3108 domain-containing protein [Proteobacteria bacterium]|nr:DUF3108 domain-containing protein [Burkholderiales bacterium]